MDELDTSFKFEKFGSFFFEVKRILLKELQKQI